MSGCHDKDTDRLWCTGLCQNKDISNNVIFAFKMSLLSELHLMTVVINPPTVHVQDMSCHGYEGVVSVSHISNKTFVRSCRKVLSHHIVLCKSMPISSTAIDNQLKESYTWTHPLVVLKIRWMDVIRCFYLLSVMTTHLVPNRCFILK